MEVILCIPGYWEPAEKEIPVMDKEIVCKTNFLYLNNTKVEVLKHDFDEGLYFSFALSGYHQMQQDEIEKIKQHKSVYYLISNIDKKEKLKDLIKIASDFLNNGGIAVKIESTGIAHSKNRWLEASKSLKNVDFFQLFVSIVIENEIMRSNGMEVLNLPDAEMKVLEDREYSYTLIRDFLYKLYKNQISVETGSNFTDLNEKYQFRLELSDDNWYDKKEIYHNSLGVWKLKII